MASDSVSLTFYGARVVVRGVDQQIKQWLNFDFSYFVTADQGPAELDIDVRIGPFVEDLIPPLVESMRSPEYVCYDEKTLRYVDYFGRTLVVYDYASQQATMYSEDVAFLYEKLYLFILSRIGEFLDHKGLHRVHALGITYADHAALFLMPSHGGKSTLAFSLLKSNSARLLSEDTPLLNRRGMALPFPMRLGISDRHIPSDVEQHHLRSFSRNRWGTKNLVHVDYFKDKIESGEHPVRLVFIGKWIHSDRPEITRISRCKACLALVRDCVIGLGLPQIVEYFLTTNKKDLLGKVGITLARTYCAVVTVIRCRPYQLLLSRDLDRNRETILAFLEEQTGQ
jgi:hypothetical protein